MTKKQETSDWADMRSHFYGQVHGAIGKDTPEARAVFALHDILTAIPVEQRAQIDVSKIVAPGMVVPVLWRLIDTINAYKSYVDADNHVDLANDDPDNNSNQ